MDQAVANAGNMHNYIVEIEGFTDRTGGKAYNLDLARRRADAVVRYLTVDKNIPLRNVRELGVGPDFPNAENHTRAQRKENRRVDVKIYALNLSGQPNTAVGSSDRLNRTTPQQQPNMPQTTPPNQPNQPQF